MVNVLFVAYEFPPLNRGGVFRSLAFVKYLPQFGINPIVITLHPDSYSAVFDKYGVDEMLGSELRQERTIIPIKSHAIKKKNRLSQFSHIYFSIHGNETEGWNDNFYKSIADIIAKYDPKAIIATLPPFSILPVVLKVSKKFGLPLIYDFRDAWSQWRTTPYGTVLHYKRTLQLEKKYLEQADAIITTSKETMTDFKSLHRSVSSYKFHYIPNGYSGDLEDWVSLDNSKENIIIGYVGSFYFNPKAREQMLMPWWKKKAHRKLQYIPQQQDWLYRSPYFFFKTLVALRDINPDLYKKIKVKFVGRIEDWLKDMIGGFGLNDKIELLGEMKHAEALKFQRECDMLLITSAKRIGGKDYSIAGKTFEYIQMQRPILAYVCEGAQKDLLMQTGMALICDPDNVQNNVIAITEFVNGKLKLSPDYDFIKTLSRESLTKQLAEVIEKVAQNN
jgi:hypothetical protein